MMQCYVLHKVLSTYLPNCIDSGTDTQNQICDRDHQEVYKPYQKNKEAERRKTKHKTSKVVRLLFDRPLLVLRRKKSKQSKVPFRLAAVKPTLHSEVQHWFPP